MQQLFVTLGPVLAVAIPAVLIARWIVRERREMHELERQARCGPGCICNGERLQERQQAPAYQQQPAPLVIQAPAPMAYQQPQAQPQIIVLQAPAPQIAYQPQPQPQVIYLPAPAGYLP